MTWTNQGATLGALKLFRKIAAFLRRLVLYPLGYLGLLAWSLTRGRLCRVAMLPLSNIGGLAYKVDTFLRRQSAAQSPVSVVFVQQGNRVANPYFVELIRRRIVFVDDGWKRALLRPVAEISNHMNATHTLTYPTSAEAGRLPPGSWFEERDHIRGRTLLADMGIRGADAWYACFFARDEAYSHQHHRGEQLDHYVSYHSCRNSSIQNQIAAMQFVLDRGGFVVRLGSTAATPVSLAHPRLIDYPFSNFRSDFADVYLACNAKFIVGDASGIVDLSSIVDIPYGWTNQPFYFMSAGRANTICIPKLICDSTSRRIISIEEFNELLPTTTNSLLESVVDTMNQRGLVYVDNSPQDILAVTMAMYYEFVAHAPPPEGVAPFCQSAGGDIWPHFLDRHPGLR